MTLYDGYITMGWRGSQLTNILMVKQKGVFFVGRIKSG